MATPADPRPRTPLDPARAVAALASAGVDGLRLRTLHLTGSTNADVAAAARAGEPAGLVVVAEEQTAGRGRLDRSWRAPPASGLLFSVLLRPPATVPLAAWGWLPLLAGLAVAAAVEAATGVPAVLKWPNDVVVDGPGLDGDPGPRKLAGVLLERVGTAAVVGVGLNVDLGRAERPTSAATSLALEAPRGLPPREEILAAVTAALVRRYDAWAAAGGDAERCGLDAEYRARCLTLGLEVGVALPGGGDLTGTAVDLTADGALVVASAHGRTLLQAGDVVHLRPAGPDQDADGASSVEA